MALKKLGIKTSGTFLVISKTVRIYKGFEIDWEMPWLHEHSLPVRLLTIEISLETIKI